MDTMAVSSIASGLLTGPAALSRPSSQPALDGPGSPMLGSPFRPKTPPYSAAGRAASSSAPRRRGFGTQDEKGTLPFLPSRHSSWSIKGTGDHTASFRVINELYASHNIYNSMPPNPSSPDMLPDPSVLLEKLFTYEEALVELKEAQKAKEAEKARKPGDPPPLKPKFNPSLNGSKLTVYSPLYGNLQFDKLVVNKPAWTPASCRAFGTWADTARSSWSRSRRHFGDHSCWRPS